MSEAAEPYRPSGRLILVLAVTVLAVSIGLLWIGTMHMDGLPAFLVLVLALSLSLGTSLGPTLLNGRRAQRRQRQEQTDDP